MKDQNGKPENGENARVLKIAEVRSPDSRREPKNTFPDKQVLCAGAEDARIRVDGVDSHKSAIISVLDASGQEIDRAEIAEGETKSIAGRAFTVLGIGLGLVAGACEYNYTYDYSDQDAATNPPLVCPTVPVTDRCEGGDNPNRLSCTAYEGSAVDFDGYLFRVADVRTESGVTKVYVDVMEKSLDCQLLHTLELTVGAENGFSVGTNSYTILPRWAEMGADPDAPAVVGLDITKTSTEPTGPVCADETDRCFYRDADGVRCVAYENRAVLLDNYLFVVKDVRDGVIVDIEVQDKELGCELTYGFSVEAGGEEITFLPSEAGPRYALKVRGASGRSRDIPATADLEVRRVSDAPVPTVCPETTDRCDDWGTFSRSCRVYQDLAVEFEGLLFTPKNIREEGGVRKLNLEVTNRERGCSVLLTAVLGQGDRTEFEIAGQPYYAEIYDIQLDAAGNWAGILAGRPFSVCEASEPADYCEPSTDSVRCTAGYLDSIELGGNKFVVRDMTADPEGARGTVTLLNCESDTEVIISVPGTATMEIGPYRYRFTVLGMDAETWSADIQIEREPLLCGGAEVRGILNVGEVIASGTGLRVRLDDISRDGEAMVTILDSMDNEYMRLALAEGGARLIEHPGGNIVVSINEVAVGVLLIGKWADITVQDCW